jgi:hypothetical protein
MNIDLSSALQLRSASAAEIMEACHTLTRACPAFNAATAIILQEISRFAVSVGERIQKQRTAELRGISSGAGEDSQRIHSARQAGEGAAAAAEHRLCQAFGSGFRGDSAGAALGCELSTEAGQFLRAAAEVAATRAPQTQPDGQFLSIVTAQHQQLRVLAQQYS